MCVHFDMCFPLSTRPVGVCVEDVGRSWSRHFWCVSWKGRTFLQGLLLFSQWGLTYASALDVAVGKVSSAILLLAAVGILLIVTKLSVPVHTYITTLRGMCLTTNGVAYGNICGHIYESVSTILSSTVLLLLLAVVRKWCCDSFVQLTSAGLTTFFLIILHVEH